MITTTVRSFNVGGQGNISYKSNTETWAQVRAKTSGHAGGYETDLRVSSYFSSGYYGIDRFFFNMDLTSIPSAAALVAARLKVYFYNTYAGNSNTISFHVVPTFQNSNSVLDDTDFDNLTFSSKGSIDYSDVVLGQYNEITIDKTILTPGAVNKFGLITSRDLNNIQPTGINGYSIYQDSDANYPKLEIDYRLASGNMFLVFPG